MSTTETPQNSPAADPRCEPGYRELTASWPVGALSESGEHKHATLKVLYHKGTGYTATLSTMHEKVESHGVRRRMNLSFDRDEVIICTREATRYKSTALSEVYTLGLAELRGRYNQGDDAVTTYFDPDSPVFDYA